MPRGKETVQFANLHLLNFIFFTAPLPHFHPATMSNAPAMAALSTLINPLGPADDELLTFWNNDSGDLVLVQRKGPSKPTDLIWTKTAKQTGIVKNPSSIVALQYQGLVCITH